MNSAGAGYSEITFWLNANQGVLALGLFAATIIAGWTSGIFSALRRRPKFKIDLIEGPTFACTFGAPSIGEQELVHRTGIALYLRIANIGSAPSSITAIKVGYHWALKPFSLDWLRYRIGWFWIDVQTVCIEDFQTNIGDSIKFYPFLTQLSAISGQSAETFLQEGREVIGVEYFEQTDSWGGCFPLSIQKRVAIRVGARDVFGKWHFSSLQIPKVTLEKARRFNPSFGFTLAALRSEDGPFELMTDDHGNILAEQPPSSDTNE